MIATSGRFSQGDPAAGTSAGRFAFAAEAEGGAFAHRRFEAAARRDPAAPAAVWPGRVLAYGELNALANRLARALRARGVGPDVRVAIAMERGPELPVALLAVLKAGGAYVPVDPAYPAERIRYVVQDSGAVLVLAHADTEARLADAGAEILSIDVHDDLLRQGEPCDLPDDPHPESLAYVIYTSGSTGRPKGVGVTHRAMASHNAAAVERYGMSPDDRVAQITSIGFDISVEEIFPTWAAGGAVVFRPAEISGYGAAFLEWLRAERVTVFNIPTAFWHAWTADLAAAGEAPQPSLRLVVVGGERPRPSTLAEWRRIAPGVRWLNGYGPTEATVTATLYEPAEVGEGEIPIGQAMAHARTHVLSEAMDGPAAAGEPGELFLGGPCVARGYLGRPGLTAERFLPDPFALEPGARLYRTGDRARVREDGELEFLGRTDDQVKVAGFRVEPGEVEAVLAEHPDVENAAVVAREFEGAGTRLVAYAVPRGDGVDAAALRRWMRGRLPGWLVPSALVMLDELPLTPHGKTDRRALPAPAALDPLPGEAEPVGATEHEVARAWAEVLGVPRVAADADFWELGGHSLLAMQVLSRVRARLGVELPVRALFDAPTVSALAARVDAARAEPVASPQPPLRAERRVAPVPPGLAQERLWLLHQAEPESPFYNLPFAIRMRGPVDVDALRRALAIVVRRHEVLRTVFHADETGAWQTVTPAPATFDLPVADLRALPAEWAEGETLRLIVDEAEHPFDLRRDPLLRALLVRLSAHEHVLALTLHHAAGDGWSIAVLFGELAALLGGGPLPDLPVQYADFAAWQREWMKGPVLEAQLEYWRARLAGAPAVLELPTDRPRPERPSHRGDARRFELRAPVVARLRALARENDATLFMVLLAAFDLLVHRLSGRDDLVVGTPVSGRVRAEVEDLVGTFVNTLAVRTDLSGDPSFRALLGRVREATLEAYAHQELPFERVVEVLRPDRALAHNPLFQVAFSWRPATTDSADLPGLSLRLEDVDVGSSRYDLSLEITERDGRLTGRMEYASDLWEPASIDRMSALYQQLLEAVSEDPGRPISAAELVDGVERRTLTRRWSGQNREYPRDSSLPAELARVAASAPDAVALAWEGGELTYGELLARASRLAGHLLRLGVRPEEPVALAMERGAESAVAAVAILRAGAVCVPVDAAERAGAILRDCGARFVVSQGTMADALPEGAARVVRTDRDAAEIAREADSDAGTAIGADAAAYLLYPAGAAPRGNGVVVPHHAVLRLVINPGIRFGAEDVMLQLAAPSSSSAMLELWGPLLNGARIAIHPPVVPTPATVAETAARRGVTAAWLPAELLHAAVEEKPAALDGVGQLMVTGGPSVAGARRVLETHRGLRLIAGYGPAESAGLACCHAVLPGDAERASIPIGRPVANTSVYVLDTRLRPAPVDVPGELYLGGDGLARGWWKAPGRTAECFIPDPFARTPGLRLFRTGDRARWRPDGTLELLGRIERPASASPAVAAAPEAAETATTTTTVAKKPAGRAELESLLKRNPAAARALAAKLRAGNAAAPAPAVAAPPKLERVPRNGPVPLSFAQQRMWFLDRLSPHAATYNIPDAMELTGPLDVEALRGAIEAMIARHEVLRTRYPEAEGRPVQDILPPPRFVLPVEEVDESQVMARMTAEARAPFDLATGLPIRARLLRVAPERHVLLVTLHHIAADGWSLGVILNEMTAHYGALSRGRQPDLPELPIQYADYAAWQREWLRGGMMERQLAFWRQRLAGAPALLELPYDRPRPAEQDERGGVLALALAADVAEPARALARSDGATLFMVLMAAWAASLHRWSGQDDIVVGSPIAARARPETEPLVGLFVNTLAMRTDVSGDPSFRTLITRVRETALEAYTHQDVPFEQIVQETGVRRSLSHSPVFQVMFGLQNVPPGDLEMEGVRVRSLAGEVSNSRFDLMVLVNEVEDRLEAYVEYATGLWDAPTIRRMMAHFEALLRAALAAPDTPVGALPMLTEDERALVVEGWNATERPAPAGVCVHDLFAQQAALAPDAPAVEFAGEALTYAEVDARSNRIARRLRAMGVGPDVRVAVSLERSVEMPVAVLAVLKAGGGYVAVDPGYPADRIAYMLEDSRAAVLVTTADVAARLPELPTPLLRLDVDAAAIDAEPADALAIDVHPENLAYVLYTSGSTGKPKGAALPHRALVNLLRWQLDRFGARKAARTLQFASLSFDVSFQEIFSTWTAGGALVLIDDDTRRDGEALVAYLREQRIERLFLPFAALQNLAETAEDARLPELREVITAGEALRSTPQLTAFYRANPGLRLDNHYGPSETHVVSAHLLAEDASAWPLLPPIGAPIDNARLYVLDARMQPAPVGVPGELFAGGAALARGYLARPALTAEKFIPDPFGAAGSRLYRTGDRARWLPDGVLEYLGRTDFQVKIRGFRIEPGEVEAVIGTHPQVREAAVAVRGEGAEKRLVAYVVPAEGWTAQTAELRAHVAEHLPDYMVPAAWVVLERMPLTPSGKVDRRALPEPADDVADEGAEGPRGPVEQVLAGLWMELLGARRVRRSDSFFELGGHSLVATRLVSRIRKALGVELPLKRLFAAPTLAGLAQQVEAARAAADGTEPVPPIRPLPRVAEPPLSFAQERMWFLDRLSGHTGAYNVPVVTELEGALDADALRGALTDVVARHEALRTRIEERGGKPVQRIAPPAPFDLRLVDVGEDGVEAAVDAETRAGFDLANDLPVRAALFRVSPERHVLVLTMHHVATDGWSIGLIQRDLAAFYAARVEGSEAGLAPLPLQYADFAAWQRRWLRGAALEAQTGFWRRQLHNAPAMLELPTDRPRPPRQSFRGTLHRFTLPAHVADGVHALATAEQVTPFMATLAAFTALLQRYTGQDDIVVGTPIAGRHRAESESIVGLFVNTLALRTHLSGDPSYRALVRRVRETTLDAYAHQDLPFERLADELNVERSLDRTPLFQVMFSVDEAAHSAHGASMQLPGVTVHDRAAPHHTAKFDLSLHLAITGGEVQCILEYATDLFDAATVARFGQHFETLLAGALEDPDRPLSAVSAVPAAELEALEAWNQAVSFPAHLESPPLHVVSAAQARRTPEKTAVSWDGGSMTFAEVDARANRLANHLIGLGVQPHSRIGICMERSPEMVIGLVAVVKAGCAYVPVDPEYPLDRKAWLLEDSAAPVVLTLARMADELPRTAARVIAVDAEWERIAESSGEDPGIDIHPLSIAYVIYTSGSTGRPKGVEVSHGGIANHMEWIKRVYPTGHDGVVLQKTPFGFDASVWEFWAPLMEGGRVHLAAPGGHRDPQYILETIRREGITTLQFVPSMLALIAGEPGLESCTSLRRIGSAGEALATEIVRRVAQRTPAAVVNLYGPTEATIHAATHTCEPDYPLSGASIGVPVDNARDYLLDNLQRHVPRGAVGELCVGGAGVARGYLNRPALTAEKFIPDPYSPVPGARMYRTGDRVRMAADGTLQYLGRTDFQVKLRGQRIELGEIEAALLRDPSVREAAVAVRGETVAGYVVAAEDVTIDPAALRESLRAELPESMVPAVIVVLDALPVTPNGKTDRKALPDPVMDAADDHAPPATPTERALAEAWAELFPGITVGREDGFFELGGHSLLAMQLLARVRGGFGVDLPVRAVFAAPRLREMAARIDAALAASEGADAELDIVPVDRDQPVPVSFAQERMWFLDRLLPGSAVYAIPYRVRLTGALVPEALRLALQDLVGRHEALRTVFAAHDGRPVQVVTPPARFDLPLTDLTALDPDAAEREAERLWQEDARRPFDLATGPLVRARLVRAEADKWMLLLNLHHVVADGWSLDILFRELALAYAARARGEAPALPPLAVQYPDYAAWQRRWLSGARLERQIEWWRTRLAGATVLELPADLPRPATPTFRGAWVEFSTDRALVDAMEAVARSEGATLFQVMLGAFSILLSRWSGQDDVVVGSPVAGRGRPETEDMVGMFVNTLALRTDLSGDPDFRAVVRRVREATVDAFAHQDVPFERLVDELKIERSLSRHPLFQVSFSLIAPTQEDPQLGDLRTAIEPGSTGTAKFDLTLQLLPNADGMWCGLEYAVDLFERETVGRLADAFLVLVRALAEDPDRPLSRLPSLMGDAERERVLRAWSGTSAPVSIDPIHLQVAEQAARTPHASALAAGGRTISYAELEARAERLAARLIAAGVRAETIVGIVAERAPETVVAILAVMKAGGAYLPLDPAYPAERLRWMLEDSGTSLIVAPASVPAALADFGGTLLRMDAEEPGDAPTPHSRTHALTHSGTHSSSLAYVIYTSGSTGRPKGVAVSHRGLGNLAAWQHRRMGLGAGDRVLSFASFSFDAAVADVFPVLANGATLVFAGREAMLPGPALLDTLRRERITFATLPPSALAVMEPANLPDLRAVLSAGEALPPAVAARWATAVALHNAYGPTEATVSSASARVAADGVPVIGRPIDNARVYVLDAAGHPAPVGVPGELYIGGSGVARGYLGRPALTAERFVPDPYSTEPGARMYRSGDRVRWRADGELEYLRRADEQVKVRGFRIEPGEIAARLMEVDGVRDALVLVRPDARGEGRLVAYVAAPERAPSVAQLREHLRRVLPDYMVPQAYMVMYSFPQTPNGKTDRAALPAPADPTAATVAAPQGELEVRIADVWRDVLNLPAVGVHDSFFEIGGHSLLVAQLQERLRTAIGRDVSMVDLFQYPTVSALAAHLDAQLRAESRVDAEGEEPGAEAEKPAGRGRGSARRELLKRGRR
jgi:amino acid adenylation domain-containing protein